MSQVVGESPDINMGFDFSNMENYLPNSRLQQFKDLLAAENMAFRETADEYNAKKEEVGRNIGFTLGAIKTAKGLRDQNITDTVKASISNPDTPNLSIDRKPFTLPVKRGVDGTWQSNVGDGKYQWSPGSNVKAGYDQVVTPNPVESTSVTPPPTDTAKGFKYNPDKIGLKSDASAFSKVGQVGGTLMSAAGTAKGIKNWDKSGTMGKANTVVNALSTISGGLGLAGLSNPFTAPLAIAGLLTSYGASQENKKRGLDTYSPYLGSAGGAASWLTQVS